MDVLLITIGVVLLLFLLILLLTHLVLKRNFSRGAYPSEPTATLYYGAYADRYPRRAISFPSGKNTLRGYVYGEGNARGLVVFAHGIKTGHQTYLREILWLVDAGWCVLAYDATGSCESDGNGTGGLVQSALDLHAALTWVEGEEALSRLPVCLMGHSWGGYAVTAGLYFGHDVRAVASLAGYSDPLAMIAEFVRMHMGRALRVLVPVVWIWLRLRHGRLGSLTAVKGIDAGTVPVLLIHGTEDETVPLDSVSIAREAPRLKNPNVEVLLIGESGQNGHCSIFRHSESVEYIEQVDEALKALKREKGQEISSSDLECFFADVDKAAYNRPNDALLTKIDGFFRTHLS